MDPQDIALLDLIEHPIFALEADEEGTPRYVAFNACALSILGRPLDAIIGKSARDVYPGHLGETAMRHHKKMLLTGTAKSYEILLPFGSEQRLVRTSLRPVLDKHGRAIRLIGTSTDVTSEVVTKTVQDSVANIQQEMEEFVSLAAHDLRTPMRHINVIADMLRDGFQDLGDGKLELIDMLESVGTKSMSLIGDILRHADATTAKEQKAEFSLTEVIKDIMGLLDPIGKCVVHMPDCKIRADRQAVQIILRNLVDNAVKHGASDDHSWIDSVPLTLRFSVASPHRGTLEFSLEDNGKGFEDPDVMFRDSRALKSEGGFGLLGIRRLLHARNGTLTAENLPDGTGAKIGFSLPGTILSLKDLVAAE